MSFNRLALTLFLLFFSMQSEAVFKNENKMMMALKDVGYDRIIVLPPRAANIQIHKLKASGKAKALPQYPIELVRSKEAKAYNFLSYFENPDDKLPLTAFKINSVMVCYLKWYPMSNLGFKMTMKSTYTISNNRTWKHCLIFPHKIEDVEEALQAVIDQDQESQ